MCRHVNESPRRPKIVFPVRTITCKLCGEKHASRSNRRIYCDECRLKLQRERMLEHRKNHGTRFCGSGRWVEETPELIGALERRDHGYLKELIAAVS